MRTSQNIFEGSTGCHEWDAGFALAEALLSRPELVRGKRCLELGSVRPTTSHGSDPRLPPVGCEASARDRL